MKIQRLRLANWRGVGAAEVEFGDGVTIVAGPNEAGKSSLIEALRFLFRYPDSSSHRDIEAVRPVHADEAPAVELEAQLGERTIHYAKRFRKAGRAGQTRLQITTPGRNAEQLTGRDAHDRAASMLGEDIDVALWEALQVEQGTGIRQASLQDKRGLQEALDAAAGTDSALSEEGALLIERAEREYQRYFTRTGRPRDALASLPDEIAQAQARREAIARRLDEVEAAADRHETLNRQCAAMQASLPELRGRADQAAQRLDAVRRLESRHAQAALQAHTLEQQVQDAGRQLAQRAAWRETIDRLTGEVDGDRSRLDGLQTALHDLKQRLLAVEQAQVAAQRRRDQATLQARLQRRAIERGALQQQREALQANLEQVSAIDARCLAERAVIDGIALEAADLEKLRGLERAAIAAQAATLAVTPTIQVAAQQALDLELRGEPVHLAAGDSIEDVATAGFALELPGVVTVTVSTTAEIRSSQAAAEAAHDALASALAARDVASLVQAERLIRDKEQARARLVDLQAQRAAWLGRRTLDELRAAENGLAAKVAAIDDELAGEEALPPDAGDLRVALADVEADAAAAQAALDEGVRRATGLRVQVNSLENEVRTTKMQVQRHEADIAAAAGDLADARAGLPDDALERQDEAGRQALARAQAALQQVDEALRAADPDSAVLLAENAAAAVERQTQEVGRLRVEIGQLEGELAQARREGLFDRLSAIETEIAGREAEWRRVERRARAADRLWRVLDAHRAAASRRYVRPLKDRIDALGRLVFNPSFAVDIGADLAIENRSLDGVTVPFDSLSGGAREQLGILARLAASQIVGEHSQVPLLLDDTLGFTDDERLTRMGAAIANVARDNQIIILTCMPSRFAYIGNARSVAL